MELDDLKNYWIQYDKKLTNQLKLNEELIRKMNLNSSKLEIKKIMILQVLKIFILFFFILSILSTSLNFFDEIHYGITGFFCTLICGIYFAFAILKLHRYRNINYDNSPIVKLQKETHEFNKLVLNLSKVETLLLPFFLITFFPLFFKSVLNLNLFENIPLFVIEVFGCLFIALPFAIWFNRQKDKKIRHAIKLIDELERFEKE